MKNLSWTNELYQVYQKVYGNSDILPIFHSTANAQVEVFVDLNGNFNRAKAVSNDDKVTIIPVTEDSGSRSSGIAPHPLGDVLKYVAGDYSVYVDKVKPNIDDYYSAYIKQLERWSSWEHSHESVRAIYKYLKKSCLIKDLIECKVFELDQSTNKLNDNKILGILQEDCFIRFIVIGATPPNTWEDKSLCDNFIQYYSNFMGKEKQLCYGTGEMTFCTYKHPSKIRNAGDKAKIISSNDEEGFTYRGRFDNKSQALSVGYEYSQKVHNALRWLIKGQGINLNSPNEEESVRRKPKGQKPYWYTETIEGELVLLCWDSSLKEMPEISSGVIDNYNGLLIDDMESPSVVDTPTNAPMKRILKDTIFNNSNHFNDNVMVMMLDSATTGRLSIVMYTELKESRFLENVQRWHESTSWYGYDFKAKKTVVKSFNIIDIIRFAYGTEKGEKDIVSCDAKVIKEYYTKIIPCIVEGRKIPQDLVKKLVDKASRPMSYNSYFNWRYVLSIACGMIKRSKLERKEECTMSLDVNNTNRSYLWGRLLAVADALENATYSFGKDGSKEDVRPTNARRLFDAFVSRPYQTWNTLYRSLNPYIIKLSSDDKTKGTCIYYTKLINQIIGMFEHQQFMDNSKLSPEYLHAYSCQLNEIYTKNKKENQE